MTSLKQMQELDRRNDYVEFRNKTESYYHQQTSIGDYKSFSGKYGSLAERNRQGNMVRVRVPGGRITQEMLRSLMKLVSKYQIHDIHFAVCQTIQLHHIDPTHLFPLMADLHEAGFFTYGAGGSYPRNIMCSHLSGVDPQEVRDLMPLALAADRFVMEQMKDPVLPAKMKIAFSGDRGNITHAYNRDLGFVARSDGLLDVYAAGSLGLHPAAGVLVMQGAQDCEVLACVQAMADVFQEYGSRFGKARCRSHYIVEELGGEDAFRRVFQEALSRIRPHYQSGSTEEYGRCKAPDESLPRPNRRIREQKQKGLFTVSYHPPGGFAKPEILEAMSQALDGIDGAEMRLSPDQSLFIINLTGCQADRITAVTEPDVAKSPLEESVACVGAATCLVGVRDSRSLLDTLIKAVRKAGLNPDMLPSLRISGCPSGCAAQQSAAIGLRGTVKVMPDKSIEPAYFLSLRGHNGRSGLQLAQEAGAICESQIAPFLIALGKEVEASGLGYDLWAAANPGCLEEIAARFIGSSQPDQPHYT